MRTLQWLLLGLAVVSLGCGGTDERRTGDEGLGGSGGSAGSGGTGGSGGSGGTGGSGGGVGGVGGGGTGGSGGGELPGDCGNGHLDAGEACDDDNLQAGDGCSDTCTLEGTCAEPIDWMLVSSEDTLGLSFRGTIRAPGASEAGSCGAAGGEVIYRIVAPHDGLFSLSHASDVDSVDWVRSSCADAATERFCRQTPLAFHTEVVAGEALFFAIDLPEGVFEVEVTIVAEVHPWRQEGESCHPGASGRCAEGLTCDDIAVFRRCVVNHAPVVAEAHVLRSGDSLSLLIEGSDANGNALRQIDMRFFDASDVPLLVADHDRDGTPDAEILSVTVDRNPGESTSFSVTAWVEGFFTRHPDAVRAEVSMRDTEQVRSAWLPADILPQPVIGLGGACDLLRRADRCELDAVCRPDSTDAPICQTLASVRQQRCDAAPLVAFGTELSGRVDRLALDWAGHWDPPAACITHDHLGTWEGAPEGLARLHLAEDVQNLVISTDVIGSMNSVLYVLAGCGIDPESLACNDDLAGDNVRSSLRFDELAAGNYLIVVDMREENRISAPWTLRVDVEE